MNRTDGSSISDGNENKIIRVIIFNIYFIISNIYAY